MSEAGPSDVDRVARSTPRRRAEHQLAAAGDRRRGRARGQGLTEYVTLLALIGLLLLGAVAAMRRAMGRAYGAVTDRIDDVTARIEGDDEVDEGVDEVPLVRPRDQRVEHDHTFARTMIVGPDGDPVRAEVCSRCGEPR